jgi:hypothetical protein
VGGTWRFDWSRPYTTDEWLDVVPTFGGHSLLPADVQAELLTRIGAAVDAAGGLFTMDYATVTATATRAPGAGRAPVNPMASRQAPRGTPGARSLRPKEVLSLVTPFGMRG